MFAQPRRRRPPAPSPNGRHGWRLGHALLLALALSFAQQHAALHWLAHAIEQVGGAKHGATGPLAQPHCKGCGAAAPFAGAVAPGPAPLWLPGLAQHDALEVEAAAGAPPLHLAYRSRAPPVDG